MPEYHHFDPLSKRVTAVNRFCKNLNLTMLPLRHMVRQFQKFTDLPQNLPHKSQHLMPLAVKAV